MPWWSEQLSKNCGCCLHQTSELVNSTRSQPRSFGPAADGANYANCGAHGNIKPPPRDKIHITYLNCGEMGHYANKCKKDVPKAKDLSGEQHVAKGVHFDDSNDKDINFTFLTNRSDAKACSCYWSNERSMPVSPPPGYY